MKPTQYFVFRKFAAALCCLLALTAVLGRSAGASAQTAGPGKIRKGQTPMAVSQGQAAYLKHYEPSNMLRVAIALTPPNPVEEKQFLEDVQDKNSPLFHQFLSADDWNTRFGPTPEAEQAVVKWAESQGLTVTHRYKHRLAVDLEGTAGTIEKAFHVVINSYQLPATVTSAGRIVYSNDRDPVLPPALDAMITGVLGLNSVEAMRPSSGSGKLTERPDYVPGEPMQMKESVQSDATAAASAGISPLTSGTLITSGGITSGGISGGGISGGYQPTNFYSSNFYDWGALMAQGHCCNPLNSPTTYTPRETSIAIASFGDVAISDIQGFGAGFPYLAYNVQKIAIDGGYTCDNSKSQDENCAEVTLDTEWSIAMGNSESNSASTARVYVYEGSTYSNAVEMDLYNFMVEEAHARTMTTSWGIEENILFGSNPEIDSYNSTMQSIDNVFASMVGQGWTLIAATGDQGSTGGCSGKIAVQFPSSSPHVLGAGGTFLNLGSSAGNYEVAWTGGTFAGTSTKASSCDSNQGGGTGGLSEYFNAPSYQSGMGYSKRALPDMSLDAISGHDVFLSGGWASYIGTSVVAPMLAGFFAQENSYLLALGNKCGNAGTSACAPLGNPLYAMYAEYFKPTAGRYPYYDITQGCTSNDETVDDHLTPWCAKTGYDLATGLGSANMLQLAWAINWETTTASGYPYIQFSGPATNHWYNTNQTVNWTVEDYTGGVGTPTGIAGETQGWDSIPSDPSSEAHGGSGNSFYSGPQFANGSTG